MPKPSNIPQVPTTETDFLNRPLLTKEGFGIENGKPYGKALADERKAMILRRRFTPGAYSALRAATKRALGRA